MRQHLILFLALLAISCSAKEDKQGYTVQSFYKGDTFYLMNRKPLTLAEAKEICKNSTMVSRPYPWDSAWTK